VKKQQKPKETDAPPILIMDANPILEPHQQIINLADVDFAAQHRKPISKQRQLMLLWRRQSAVEAVKDLDHEHEIFGFTKGQFSLLDLMKAILQKTGPADVSLSTWTASRKEAIELTAMKTAGTIRTMRWLVDLTFVRRDPEAAHAIRQAFGVEAIRVANVHSKFCLFETDAWRLVLRGSFNLNMNPRTEDFTIAHDPGLFAFIETMLTKIWAHQPAGLDKIKPYDVHKIFGKLE